MTPRVLLCDADDCLFGSEAPAFAASTRLVNDLLARLGIPRSFAPDELRAAAAGKNFRLTALELAAAHGAELAPAELEGWVRAERDAVIAHLKAVLRPDPSVAEPLARLAERLRLAVVSSSALARLDACFAATGLGALLPPRVRFSAEDSLPVPRSKPDPAIYAWAGAQLGVSGSEALAVEDSVTGVRSAAAAGFPVVGNVVFVPEGERAERTAALRAAGASGVVTSWGELERRLTASRPPGTAASADGVAGARRSTRARAGRDR